MDVNPRERVYTVDEASDICGVLPSTVRYWLGPYGRTITADVADSGRQGSRKLLSARNLVQIRVAFLLSDADWPKAVIARELPKILNPRLDWYTPGSQVWGKLEWLLFADRKISDHGRWDLMSSGESEGPFGFFQAVGAQAEMALFTYPDGYQPSGKHDLAGHLKGVRRLTVVNLAAVKRRVAPAA